jgi:hypothetical protein
MGWLSQRVDFNTVEFYRTINQKGYTVVWEKSSICPCITKDREGQPDFNCPLCYGKGRYYFDPQNILGIMTAFTNEAKWNQTGEILQGASYFTCLPESKLGFWDRVTNYHSKIRYSEVLIKGIANGADRLRFKPVEVLGLRTVSNPYAKDRDFRYDETNQSIDWSLTGIEPNSGEQYSVEYLCHPRWIVIDLVNVLRDTQVKAKKPGVQFTEMPVRAMIRLEFFVV